MASKTKSEKKSTGVPKPNAEVTSAEEQQKEGRVHHRVPVQLLVDYRADGHYLFDFCRDLGTGGVFIETQHPLSHGSVVDLTFTLPDSKETLEAKGRVIWVQQEVPNRSPAGMGVQFEEFTPEQRRVLQNFVNRYRGQGGSDKSA